MLLRSLNISFYIRNLCKWLINACFVQLLIGVLSVPFMISWGLTYSWLSLPGNIFMSPFLIVILLTSSLLFLGALVGIESAFLIWILESTVSSWNWVLSFGSRIFLFGFKEPSFFFLCMIPISACLILLHPYIRSRLFARLITLSSIIFFWFYLHHAWYIRQPLLNNVHVPYGSLTIATDNGKTIIVDNASSSIRGNIDSWINYTLTPEIIRSTGKLKIDHYVCLRPSARIVHIIKELSHIFEIKRIYVDGTRMKQMILEELKTACKELNIHCINVPPAYINLSSRSVFERLPYPVITINGQSFTISHIR